MDGFYIVVYAFLVVPTVKTVGDYQLEVCIRYICAIMLEVFLAI